MYRYHYINTNSGASVFSHKPLDRENLVLKGKFKIKDEARNTQYVPEEVKPIRLDKPKVFKNTRNTKKNEKSKK